MMSFVDVFGVGSGGSKRYKYSPPVIPTTIQQEVVDSVLSGYEAALADSRSPYSLFFAALNSASGKDQYDVFRRVYFGLRDGRFSIDDYLVYVSTEGLEISIETISSYVRYSFEFKASRMREKIYNGNYAAYGNFYAFLGQRVINDPRSEAVFTIVEESSQLFSQPNSFMLRPVISYDGEPGAYRSYSDAESDYWRIASEHLSQAVLSGLQELSATLEEGSRSLTFTPSDAQVRQLTNITKTSGSGEFGLNAMVSFEGLNAVGGNMTVSVPHIKSGPVTFKVGLPPEYKTDLSFRAINEAFNRHFSNSAGYSPLLMSDVSSKSSYSTSSSSSSEIARIVRGAFLKISQEELYSEIERMIYDLVDFYDGQSPDYEDYLDLPDIRSFVESKLASIVGAQRERLGLSDLVTLKFYNRIVAPFVQYESGAATALESDLDGEFSSLRSVLLGLRLALQASGNFI
jgi:hypothetical protein